MVQIYVSIRQRDELRDVGSDPWGGRTLEWSTSSPPPPYNFAFIPRVHDSDAWTDMKKHGYQRPLEGFNDIHMPRNTGAGILLAALGTIFGFAMVWYIWWLAVVSFVALIACAIAHTFNYDRDSHLSAQEVGRIRTTHRQLGAEGTGRNRMNTIAVDTASSGPWAFLSREEAHPHNGTLLGFWLYLMSDCLIFAALFACNAVLGTQLRRLARALTTCSICPAWP